MNEIHAKWSLEVQKDPSWPFCTNCGSFANAKMKIPIGIKQILEPEYSNFCPNCGANMMGAYGKVKNISYKGIKNE